MATPSPLRPPLLWLLERDPAEGARLREYLERRGYDLRIFTDDNLIQRYLMRERADLLLLGCGADTSAGVTLCRRLRADGDDVPIILLAPTNSSEERIRGLESGADDYLSNSITPRELAARIQSLLRRRQALPAGAPQSADHHLSFGDCRLDLTARELYRNGRKIELTGGEFALLAALAQNPLRSLSRERLVELARGPGSASSERSVDVQVSRLRKLIENEPSSPRYIQTVWGHGYVFVAPVEQPSSGVLDEPH